MRARWEKQKPKRNKLNRRKLQSGMPTAFVVHGLGVGPVHSQRRARAWDTMRSQRHSNFTARRTTNDACQSRLAHVRLKTAPKRLPSSRGSSVVDMSIRADVLVDDLLQRISRTDGGPSTTPAERGIIDETVLSLCALGMRQKPLEDPSLFDCYSVAYTSSGAQQDPRGVPAGGRFRGRIGRLFFLSRGLFQHVIAPSTVVNLVCFKLFGVLCGAVGLRGKLTPLADAGDFGPNGIRVDFEPPRISFGGLVFQFGPPSEVQLKTTYLDDRIRIGIGSRGSLFVFTRGGAARGEVSQEWKILFQAQGRKLIPFRVAAGIAAALGASAVFLPASCSVAALVAALILGHYSKVKFADCP
jgi:hypothetical protein